LSFIKFLLIITLSIFFNTNSYSKTLKTEIVAENEYGGLYAIKQPMFSAKRRWQPTFNKVNDMAERNCNNYSKNSYLFVISGLSNLTIQPDGKLKVNALKQEQGYVPDYSYTTRMYWDTYRFFCGQNLDDALNNHALRYKIFSPELFSNSIINDSAVKYISNKNNDHRYEVKDVPEELKNAKRETFEVDQTQYTTTGWAEKNIGVADFESAIKQAKKTCKELGFKQESEKISECIMELIEISDAYAVTKAQEKILIAKAKKQENIIVESNYETSSGQKIKKESKWTKFWQGAAWILYEYGDEIFALALDLKYDTNLSGYNSNTEVSSNRGGLRCVSQRVGNVVHQNCKGGRTHIYCMYQKVGKNFVKRTCRDKSI
tara:strand:- start:46 stop:1170 length:1125 start_codon:yes stop_codon:yes gene_type:complete